MDRVQTSAIETSKSETERTISSIAKEVVIDANSFSKVCRIELNNVSNGCDFNQLSSKSASVSPSARKSMYSCPFGVYRHIGQSSSCGSSSAAVVVVRLESSGVAGRGTGAAIIREAAGLKNCCGWRWSSADETAGGVCAVVVSGLKLDTFRCCWGGKYFVGSSLVNEVDVGVF